MIPKSIYIYCLKFSCIILLYVGKCNRRTTERGVIHRRNISFSTTTMARENKLRLSDDELDRLKRTHRLIYGEHSDDMAMGATVDFLCQNVIYQSDLRKEVQR